MLLLLANSKSFFIKFLNFFLKYLLKTYILKTKFFLFFDCSMNDFVIILLKAINVYV